MAPGEMTMSLLERLESDGLVDEVARIRGLSPAGLRSRIKRVEAALVAASAAKAEAEQELAAIERVRGPISALRAARDRLPQSAAALLARHDELEKAAAAGPSDAALAARLDECRQAIRIVALALGLVEDGEHALAARSELRDLAAARHLPERAAKPPAVRKVASSRPDGGTAPVKGSTLAPKSLRVKDFLRYGPRDEVEVRKVCLIDEDNRASAVRIANLVRRGHIVRDGDQLSLPAPAAVED